MSKTYLLGLTAAMLASGAGAQNTTVFGDKGERVASTAAVKSELGEPTMNIRLDKNGQTNTLYFRPAGRLEVLIDRTHSSVNGTYVVQGNQVCIDLPVRGRDCWPYDATAAAGSVVHLTSERGQKITATYLTMGGVMRDRDMTGAMSTSRN